MQSSLFKCRLPLAASLLLACFPAGSAAAINSLDQARRAIHTRRLDRAEVLLRSWLRYHPSDEDAQFELARVLSWEGKSARALLLYNRLLQRSPHNADYLLGKAYTLIWAGRDREALPLLQAARKLAPAYEEVWKVEIQTLARLDNQPQLSAVLAEASRLFPNTRWSAYTRTAIQSPAAQSQNAAQPLTADLQAPASRVIIPSSGDQPKGSAQGSASQPGGPAPAPGDHPRVPNGPGARPSPAPGGTLPQPSNDRPKSPGAASGGSPAPGSGTQPGNQTTPDDQPKSPVGSENHAQAPAGSGDRPEAPGASTGSPPSPSQDQPKTPAASKDVPGAGYRGGIILASLASREIIPGSRVGSTLLPAPPVQTRMTAVEYQAPDSSGRQPANDSSSPSDGFSTSDSSSPSDGVQPGSPTRQVTVASASPLDNPKGVVPYGDQPKGTGSNGGASPSSSWGGHFPVPGPSRPRMGTRGGISPGRSSPLPQPVAADQGTGQPALPTGNSTTSDAVKWQQIQSAIASRHLPLAEILLNQWLTTHEKDQNAELVLARVLTMEGKTVEAENHFDRLLVAAPDNPDYLLGKALALLRSRNPAGAVPLLERARAVAPKYEDVYRAEIQALRETRDESQLKTVLQAASQQFPNARWITAQSRGPHPVTLGPGAIPVGSGAGAAGRQTPVEIETGITYDFLNKGFADWRDYYVFGSAALGDRKTVYGHYDEINRFSLEDHQLTAGIYYPIAEQWEGSLEVQGSSTYQVVPEYSVLGQVERSLGGGWNVQGGFRHSKYRQTDTNNELLEVEHYFGPNSASYTLNVGESSNAGNAVGHALRLSHYYGDRNVVSGGITFGKELERVSPVQVLSSDVFSLYLSGRHWWAPLWAVSYELGWTHQGNIYDRTRTSLGVRHLF